MVGHDQNCCACCKRYVLYVRNHNWDNHFLHGKPGIGGDIDMHGSPASGLEI